MCSVGLSSDKRRGSLGNLSIAFTASSPRARGLRNGRAARGLLVRKLPFLFNRFQRQFALRPRAGTALAWGTKRSRREARGRAGAPAGLQFSHLPSHFAQKETGHKEANHFRNHRSGGVPCRPRRSRGTARRARRQRR